MLDLLYFGLIALGWTIVPIVLLWIVFKILFKGLTHANPKIDNSSKKINYVLRGALIPTAFVFIWGMVFSVVAIYLALTTGIPESYSSSLVLWTIYFFVPGLIISIPIGMIVGWFYGKSKSR